jgi:hypothetical protein
VRVVPLPDLRPGTTQLRLRLTRGHWRIDYQALAQLKDSASTLVTLPGDEYTLVYQLPRQIA